MHHVSNRKSTNLSSRAHSDTTSASCDRFGTSSEATGPSWCLGPAGESKAIEKVLSDLAPECRRFREDIQGKLAGLAFGANGGAALAQAIARYEDLVMRSNDAVAFAHLRHAENQTDPEANRLITFAGEQSVALRVELQFFELELNRLDDLPGLSSSPVDTSRNPADSSLAIYDGWLTQLRRFRPHQLSEGEERVLSEMFSVGQTAWVRLYDRQQGNFSVTLAQPDGDGRESANLSDCLARLHDPKESVRRDAFEALTDGLRRNRDQYADIFNSLLKAHEIENRLRRFPNPAASRHLDNQVDERVVTSLVASVTQTYAPICHRYYRGKAKQMNKTLLGWHDRLAPPEDADLAPISFAEGKGIVLEAFERFSKPFADLAEGLFDGRIDAAARSGKDAGAFCCAPSAMTRPYILLTWKGLSRDVLTLAHELGHGVHQLLSMERGELTAHAPMVLAETASIFAEMVTFRALLERVPDRKARRALLQAQIEDSINTIHRQIAFHHFETEVHNLRKEGPVSADRLDQAFLAASKAQLGDGFDHQERCGSMWSYVMHFFHMPFYVYAYAFGDCLTRALHGVFEEGQGDFETRYFDLLRLGGAKPHGQALAPFGLDAGREDFWDLGLRHLEGLVVEWEELGH